MPSFTESPRFQTAIRRFDAANASDPNHEPGVDGSLPRELLYARRLTEWVLALEPNASEALRLAARCQHLCRWEIPRDSYPADRAGYLRWRRDLQQFHARKAAEVLTEVGYDAETIARVQGLNRKQDLGRDAELQVLEDALCLVFLQYQLEDLMRKKDDETLVNALRKSWGKMSEAGRAAAAKIRLSERARGLVRRALEVPTAESGVA